MSKPLVAIVGRPNVGKSTLINGLAQRRVSIVEDIPGVTRDRIYCDVKWLDRELTLIDTGGIEFKDERDQISSGIRQQAELAIDEADVILFVVDARTGMTADDETIAGLLRRTGKPVVLCVNKVDSENQEMDVYEFYSLGLGDPVGISAVNRLGFGELLDRITEGFPARTEESSEDIIRTAIVGRPNVGKSTLINRLAGARRAEVGDRPGVTRANQWVKVNPYLEVMDTPGMLWPKLEDQELAKHLAFLGSIKDEIMDSEELATDLIALLQSMVSSQLTERFSKLASDTPKEELLNTVCRSRGFLLRGGELDTERASHVALDEFRAGKIARVTLEQPEARG